MGSQRVGHNWATDLIWSVVVTGTRPQFTMWKSERPPIPLPTSWKQRCSLRLIQEDTSIQPYQQQPTRPWPSCWFRPTNRVLWPELHVLVTSLLSNQVHNEQFASKSNTLSVFIQLSSAAASFFFFLPTFGHLYKFKKLISSKGFFPLLNFVFWLIIYECVTFYEQ